MGYSSKEKTVKECLKDSYTFCWSQKLSCQSGSRDRELVCFVLLQQITQGWITHKENRLFGYLRDGVPKEHGAAH